MKIDIEKFHIHHPRKLMYRNRTELSIPDGDLPEFLDIIGKTKVVRFVLYLTDKSYGGRYMSKESDYQVIVVGDVD